MVPPGGHGPRHAAPPAWALAEHAVALEADLFLLDD